MESPIRFHIPKKNCWDPHKGFNSYKNSVGASEKVSHSEKKKKTVRTPEKVSPIKKKLDP